MQEALEKLGFSKHEAGVYLALLEVGPCSSAPIIKKTSLHRNIVYETLDKLIAKKFATQTTKDGKLHFSVLDPGQILRSEQERLTEAEKLVPILQAKLKRDRQQVVIHEGIEEHLRLGIEKVETMKDGGAVAILGGGGEWYEHATSAYIKKYDETREKKNIKLQIIFYQGEYDRAGAKVLMKRPLIEIGVIADLQNSPATTVIWDDSLGIDVWGDPVTTIEIQGKEVAQAYRDYFNLMWSLAKK